MNELNDRILNHRVLQKLIEMNLVSQSEVRRLIMEEVSNEGRLTAQAAANAMAKIRGEDPKAAIKSVRKALTRFAKGPEKFVSDKAWVYKTQQRIKKHGEALTKELAKIDKFKEPLEAFLKIPAIEPEAAPKPVDADTWDPTSRDSKELLDAFKKYAKSFYYVVDKEGEFRFAPSGKRARQTMKAQSRMVRELRAALRNILKKEAAEAGEEKGFAAGDEDLQEQEEDQKPISIKNFKSLLETYQFLLGKLDDLLLKWVRSAEKGLTIQRDYKRDLVKLIERVQELAKKIYGLGMKMVKVEGPSPQNEGLLKEYVQITQDNIVDVTKEVQEVHKKVVDVFTRIIGPASKPGANMSYREVRDECVEVDKALANITKYFAELSRFGEKSAKDVTFDKIKDRYREAVKQLNIPFAIVKRMDEITPGGAGSQTIEQTMIEIKDFSVELEKIFGVDGIAEETPEPPRPDPSTIVPGQAPDQAPPEITRGRATDTPQDQAPPEEEEELEDEPTQAAEISIGNDVSFSDFRNQWRNILPYSQFPNIDRQTQDAFRKFITILRAENEQDEQLQENVMSNIMNAIKSLGQRKFAILRDKLGVNRRQLLGAFLDMHRQGDSEDLKKTFKFFKDVDPQKLSSGLDVVRKAKITSQNMDRKKLAKLLANRVKYSDASPEEKYSDTLKILNNNKQDLIAAAESIANDVAEGDSSIKIIKKILDAGLVKNPELSGKLFDVMKSESDIRADYTGGFDEDIAEFVKNWLDKADTPPPDATEDEETEQTAPEVDQEQQAMIDKANELIQKGVYFGDMQFDKIYARDGKIWFSTYERGESEVKVYELEIDSLKDISKGQITDTRTNELKDLNTGYADWFKEQFPDKVPPDATEDEETEQVPRPDAAIQKFYQDYEAAKGILSEEDAKSHAEALNKIAKAGNLYLKSTKGAEASQVIKVEPTREMNREAGAPIIVTLAGPLAEEQVLLPEDINEKRLFYKELQNEHRRLQEAIKVLIKAELRKLNG